MASAHTFWLQATEVGAHLFLGDASDDEAYEEESVEEAGALGLDGAPLEVEMVYDHGHMHLRAPGAPVLWLKADYGFWRKTVRGWQEGSKRDPGRTIDSAWHLQYAKLEKQYQGPVSIGLELEIVLDSIESGKLTGTVYHKGQAIKGVALYRAHKKVARTDKKGKFRISAPKGRTVLSAVLKEKLENHPDADRRILTSTYTLGRE